MLRIDDKIINPSNICFIEWSIYSGYCDIEITFNGNTCISFTCAPRELEPLLDRILNAKC